jgi:hypothetical protein
VAGHAERSDGVLSLDFEALEGAARAPITASELEAQLVTLQLSIEHNSAHSNWARITLILRANQAMLGRSLNSDSRPHLAEYFRTYGQPVLSRLARNIV